MILDVMISLHNNFKRYDKSTAQLLICWCVQHNYVCIPKSVREERIIENANVFDFAISDEDMQIMVYLSSYLHIINFINVCYIMFLLGSDITNFQTFLKSFLEPNLHMVRILMEYHQI